MGDQQHGQRGLGLDDPRSRTGVGQLMAGLKQASALAYIHGPPLFAPACVLSTVRITISWSMPIRNMFFCEVVFFEVTVFVAVVSAIPALSTQRAADIYYAIAVQIYCSAACEQREVRFAAPTPSSLRPGRPHIMFDGWPRLPSKRAAEHACISGCARLPPQQ